MKQGVERGDVRLGEPSNWNGSSGGELMAVRGNPTGEQVVHTEIAGESPVAQGDSSERSSSTSDTGYIDDLFRDEPPTNSPDNP